MSLKQSQIAEKVGVDKLAISREFGRNKGQRHNRHGSGIVHQL